MCHCGVDVEEISITGSINIHGKCGECFPSAIDFRFCRHYTFGTNEVMGSVKGELSDRTAMLKPVIAGASFGRASIQQIAVSHISIFTARDKIKQVQILLVELKGF
jgi:hypothetical protein